MCYYGNMTSTKEQNINKLRAYLKTNPNTNYAQAAKAMHKTPRTIRNWCGEWNIKLPTASAAGQLSPPHASVHPRAQSQSYFSLDDLGKTIDDLNKFETFKNRLRKEIEDSRPAFGPGSAPRQAKSAEEYETLVNLDIKRAHEQAKDEMLKSVLLPLSDFLGQLLVRLFGGLK